MEKLLAWSECEPNRHFLVRKAGSCNETHWRVAVWVKAEAEPYGIAGHGSGESLGEAIDRAIEDWKRQDPETHKPSAFWYAPRLWVKE